MKKNNFSRKTKGFSIAYAIVGLIVTAIAIVAITPVLTRKLNNLATSAMIKNPKGWYESYNAYEHGTRYCSECIEADKNGEKWTEPKYDSTIPEKDDGDPKYNPYVDPEDPHKPVPYERYCKSNGKCGYPKDKQEPGENAPTDKPHKCKDGKCKFKPSSGITKYEVYAVGGGGGSGSAVNKDVDNSNLRGRAGQEITLDGGSKTGDDIVKASFIDEKRIDDLDADEDKITPTDKPSGFNDGNILENNNRKVWDYFYVIGKPEVNFHTYPTEATNTVLAKVHGKNIKRILKNQSKREDETDSRGKKYSDRYYWYTKVVGASQYNQTPELTLMPEWVSIDGYETRYPDPDPNPNSNPNPVVNPTPNETNPKLDGYPENKPILGKYPQVVTVACSGKGQKGAKATCKDTIKQCSWMKPDVCPYYLDKEEKLGSMGTGYHDYMVTGVRGVAPDHKCKPGEHPPEDTDAVREVTMRGNHKAKYCLGGYVNSNWDINDNTVECNTDKLYYNRKLKKVDSAESAWESCTCGGENTIYLKPACNNNDDIIGSTRFGQGYIELDACDKLQTIKNIVVNHFYDNISFDNPIVSYLTYRDGNEIITIKDDTESFVGPPCNRLLSSTQCSSNGYETLQRIINWIDTQNSTYADKVTEKGENSKSCQERKTKLTIKVDAYGKTVTAHCPRTNLELIKKSNAPGEGGEGICAYISQKIEKKVINAINTDGTKYTYSPAQKEDEVVTNNNCSTSRAHNGYDSYACIHTKKNRLNTANCHCAEGGQGGENSKFNYSDIAMCNRDSVYSAQQQGADGNILGAEPYHISDWNSRTINECGGQSGWETSGIEVGGDTFEKSNPPRDEQIGSIAGTQKKAGMYNWRYRWQMPYVTKHLMFGTAGEGGEEVHTMVNLTEGQNLDVVPGKGAAKTDYKSGANGGNGTESTVSSNEANISLLAKGGNGGKGSQKTDEYLLCHIADLISGDTNINRPCHENDTKSTGKYEGEGRDRKFKGIQAILPKISNLINSFRMSDTLKSITPGKGGMGYGTESVSDFVCEERKIGKLDEIYTSGTAHETKGTPVVTQGGSNEKCKGNSKIQYILPHGKNYTPSTGAVIILW